MSCRIVLECCFVLFQLFGVLFLILCNCLLVCARVCVLDGAPFEEPQEQGFEEFEQQQPPCVNEGKWILDHVFYPNDH